MRHRLHLLGRRPLGEDLVYPDDRAHRVRHRGPVSGDHDDPVDAAAAQLPDGPAASGRIGSSSTRSADRSAVDPDEDGDGAVELGPPPSRRGPSGDGRDHRTQSGVADGDDVLPQPSPDAMAGNLLDVARQDQPRPRCSGGLHDGSGKHVGRHLIERGGQAQDLDRSPSTPAVTTWPSTSGARR